MAATKIIGFFICLNFVLFCAVSASGINSRGRTGEQERSCSYYHGKPTRQELLSIFISQLGIRELTGNNDGKEVEMYLHAVGLKKGPPWCAAFVSWGYLQVGIRAARSAWSPDWFPVKRVIWKQGRGEQPQPCDVFGIYFPDKKRIAHVGIVEQWGESVLTIEGNTNDAGSREGDGVYRKRRLQRQLYAVSCWFVW
jgi:hypothetical protein